MSSEHSNLLKAYRCPHNSSSLEVVSDGLSSSDGTVYPFFQGKTDITICDFSDAALQTQDDYNGEFEIEKYHNFLDWLFSTFSIEETDFRTSLASHLNLKQGDKVLIIGCGLGSDIPFIAEQVGESGQIYANDLSTTMVFEASYLAEEHANLSLAVCDAHKLPFANNYFDACLHFGGINLFENKAQAIQEMDRVVKTGGRVVFGDEGVAPWLQQTELGKIVINNNALWASSPPLDLLPSTAKNVNLNWILSNCFYLIDYCVGDKMPTINLDIPNKGHRGGTMQTRYYGQLEGVSLESKSLANKLASDSGLSMHDWLDKLIKSQEQTNN